MSELEKYINKLERTRNDYQQRAPALAQDLADAQTGLQITTTIVLDLKDVMKRLSDNPDSSSSTENPQGEK